MIFNKTEIRLTREWQNSICFLSTVLYLNYGPYSSYAPHYDSTFANISKDDSDLIYSAYGEDSDLRSDFRWVTNSSVSRMPRFSETLIDLCISKGCGPNWRCNLETLSPHVSPEVNKVTLGRKWRAGASPGLSPGASVIERVLLLLEGFPRSISCLWVLDIV